MSPPVAQWPTLLGVASTAPADTTRRVMNIHDDVQSLLRFINGHSGLRVPSKMVENLRNVEELTTGLIRNPLGAQWSDQLVSIQRDNEAIRKELGVIREAQLAQQVPIRPSVASYAAAARGAPASAHHLSSHGSTSSVPASPPTVKGDRELTVRLDTAAVATYCRETTASMTDKIDKLHVKVAWLKLITPLASVKVVVVYQLVSGNIRLTVRSVREAELMRTHHKWVASLSKKAELLLPIWDVVIYNINLRSIGLNSPRVDELWKEDIQRRVIDQLLSLNRYNWGDAKITRVFWLRTPIGKKSGLLVAEFTSPIPTNTAIDHGVLWDGNYLYTMVYDRVIYVYQCHNYQKWGYIGPTCPSKLTCVYCAGLYLSRDCEAKYGGTLIENKCSNYGGVYAVWDKDCPTKV